MTILYHSIFWGGFNQVSIKVLCERTISQEREREGERQCVHHYRFTI